MFTCPTFSTCQRSCLFSVGSRGWEWGRWMQSSMTKWQTQALRSFSHNINYVSECVSILVSLSKTNGALFTISILKIRLKRVQLHHKLEIFTTSKLFLVTPQLSKVERILKTSLSFNLEVEEMRCKESSASDPWDHHETIPCGWPLDLCKGLAPGWTVPHSSPWSS